MQIADTHGLSLSQTDLASLKENKGKTIRRQWALFLLRIVVGYGFMAHGWAKLSRGPIVFAGVLQHLGVPLPILSASLTIATELLGGAAMFVGAFVVWASIPMGLVLLVAALTVHLRYGFSSIKLLAVSSTGATFGPVGYELDLLYVAALFTLALAGPGALAADNTLQPDTKSA